MLEKAEMSLRQVERLAQFFPQMKKGSRHSAAKMLVQRVFGICQGWEDCNDFDLLRSDPHLCHVPGSLPASQPPLSHLENSVGSTQLMHLSLELVQAFVERHGRPHSRAAGVRVLSRVLRAPLLPTAPCLLLG